jgi:hypothetical protein
VCVVLAGLTVYLFVASAPAAPRAAEALDPKVPALPLVVSCKAARDQAGTRAHELERLARAHWERVPFDESEAPLACEQMDEAAHCHALAQDREGRARSEAFHARCALELRARVERRGFLLSLAQKNQDAAAIEREARALLLLFSRSGDDAAPYRATLSLLARRARARLLEAAMLEKEKS